MEQYKIDSRISPHIFRAYDIRGIYGTDLSGDTAKTIGMAYGSYLKSKLGLAKEGRIRVSVGRDVRLSSRALMDALIQGLTGTGISVTDLGVCPTPLLYFSLFITDLDGGIMITGSHNPPEYNGFKVCVGRDTIYGDEIIRLKDIAKTLAAKGVDAVPSVGSVEKYDVTGKYIRFMKEKFYSRHSEETVRGLKVVMDAGNGVAGLVAPDILRGIGCDVIELYCNPDGRFPNHHPDPTVADNLSDLISVVKKEGADIGLAYDGDADRIGVVDEKGDIVWADRLMALFAGEILRDREGERPMFIGEVKCSQAMYDYIDEMGGRAVMWKTGHSLLKAKMKAEGALLSGEMSGHIFFADRYFGYDDAIYASLRLIEILRKSGRTISSMMKNIPQTFSTPEIRIEIDEERKFDIVEELVCFYKRLLNTCEAGDMKVIELITIDGARVVFEGGWALVRASNTQPVLVLRYEAVSEERLEEIKSFFYKNLERISGRQD